MNAPQSEKDVLQRPKDRHEALSRIEDLVREIEIICDEFDLDPAQWLIGETDDAWVETRK